MSSHWQDNKRAFEFVFLLVHLDIVDWENRHNLLEYWSKHGSKPSIRNKD